MENCIVVKNEDVKLFLSIAISVILGRDVAVTATAGNFAGHFTEHLKNADLIVFPE